MKHGENTNKKQLNKATGKTTKQGNPYQFVITRLMSDQIALHSVQLQL